MSVVVHEEKCKGCRICVTVCPYGAISMQKKKAIINDACTSCGACIDSCEFGAITFEGSRNRIQMDVTPFSGIYVLVEHAAQTASKVSLELLGKARSLANEFSRMGKNQMVTAIVLGHDLGNLPDDVIHHGADHVIIAKDKSFALYSTDTYTRAIVQIAREKRPEIFLLGATPLGRDLAPRVANRLRTGLTADCTALEICPQEGILLQTRPAFGGNMMATIVCPDNRPQMATVRPGVMRQSACDLKRTGTKEVLTINLEEKDFITRVLDIIASTKKHVKLEDARIIVAGGHGVKTRKGFKLLENLATELEAEVGASRAAVDAGQIGPEHQIGQTGKTVQPELYIACGISGAIQHLAGIMQSKHIVSINTDSRAPIVAASDVTFVGDLFQIVPLLTAKIREYKEKGGPVCV